MLSPWLEPETADTQTMNAPEAEVTEEPEATVQADTAYRDALISEIGPEVYNTLMANFIDEAGSLLETARTTKSEEERDRSLHSLKGSALTLGLNRVAALAEEARRADRAGPEQFERISAVLAADTAASTVKCA